MKLFAQNMLKEGIEPLGLELTVPYVTTTTFEHYIITSLPTHLLRKYLLEGESNHPSPILNKTISS